jgi:hypothetical protein
LTQADHDNHLGYAQAMNIIIRALCIPEYYRVYKLEPTHEMWGKLIDAHEGINHISLLSPSYHQHSKLNHFRIHFVDNEFEKTN